MLEQFEFIDDTPPSNATKFFGSPDKLTVVISAFLMQAQTQAPTVSGVPVLGSTGLLNTISNSDTATVTIAGNFRGIALAFASSTSDCLHPFSNGPASLGSISIPNVPVNVETFFCVTGSGAVLGSNPSGFSTITVSPGTSTDFLSVAVTVDFPGFICYKKGAAGGCDASFVPPPLVVSTPALSGWAVIGLAGIILLFGPWKVKAIAATP
jgi:hypothetical protein